jgi:peptidyl-prolyl cis-trans isomerase SurA
MNTTMIKSAIVLVLAMFASSVFAQNDPILMTIAGDNITKSEFLNVYYKNNNKSTAIDKKSLDEYLELFINYKLKVKEATEMGLDTAAAFKNELAGYRKQLAQPYLVDKDVTDQLIKEAYDRMKFDIRASHILIKLDANALPKDTLIAYNKIFNIRKRIVGGEDFGKLASELSDDPSARDQEANKEHPAVKGNKGDLGYFTVLDMVYPFETAAYNTKPGDVSMPVRTSFGYHLIKVNDKRAAMGKVQVAHIFVALPKVDSAGAADKAKSKIDEIYTKVQKGEVFEELAKQYSEDKGSGSKGGVLPWFGCNRMVPEFIVAVSSLTKKNDISAPVKTPYGWHIIKLLDRKEIGSFDDVKADLKQRISKDMRSARSKDAIVTRIKKENHYNPEILARNDFYTAVDDKIFENKWTIDQAKDLNKQMFILGDKSYSQQDFAKFLIANQSFRTKENIEVYINTMFNQFVDESCINFEDNQLEAKYPDFRSVMKEYKDGILLFELTDTKVWSKAVKDSTGLDAFYSKNKENYMWSDRLDASIYTCANQKVADQTKDLVKKAAKKKYSSDDILALVNKDSQLNLQIESGKFSKGDNKIIDGLNWVPGISNFITSDKSVVFVDVHKKLSPMPKTLFEARGLITADYQNYLEKEWLIGLKKKYPVSVNQDVFSTIK